MSSWFDGGLANIAKNALKEAQSRIDKVLDINDVDDLRTLDSESEVKENQKNILSTEWDSTGTFFENTISNEIITTTPKIGSITATTAEIALTLASLPENIESESQSPPENTTDTSEATLNYSADTQGESKYSPATVLSDSTHSFEAIHANDCLSRSSAAGLLLEHEISEDILKIHSISVSGSEQNSNDEIDTATSSDIEIISNPNGDSSSTQSCIIKKQTPSSNQAIGVRSTNASTPAKGHIRGPSEVSTQSEDSQSETEKLLIRISELNGILEAREFRLLELNRQNAALNDRNLEIQALLDEVNEKKSEDIDDTHRLSALEKKFQSSIRERDAMRIQIKTLRDENDLKVPKDDLDKITTEKDQIILELRNEGEKLSKQILQHSNIIKKLRVKEKESDSVLKRNKEQIDLLTEEVERLKKSLSAKEEVERTQIEAVHKLCTDKRKLEKTNQVYSSQNEDLVSKLEALQTAFDVLKKELQERQDSHIELTRKTEILSNIEKEKIKAESQSLEVLDELRELREKLKSSEFNITIREQKLRLENTDLLKRLEISESRAEELTQEISVLTIPLLRQLEGLQSNLTTRTDSWHRQEKELVDQLESCQNQLKTLDLIKTSSIQEISLLKAKIKNVEDQLSGSLLKLEQAKGENQQIQMEFNLKEISLKRNIEKLIDHQSKLDKLNENLKQDILKLHQDLENEKLKIKPDVFEETNDKVEHLHESATIGGKNSPTFSIGRNSIAESVESSAWQLEDLDCISNSARHQSSNSVYGFNLGYLGGEHLQSTLKQKDGELCQLQWELSRLNSERNILNAEISKITLELEQIKEKLITHEAMETDFAELQHKYDALQQMYGEKVEQNEELNLDLQDVKDMYKAQIDELLRQGYKF